jgi:hypothetical protein
MNRREFVATTLAGLVLSKAPRVAGQAKAITPDLGALADGKRLTLVNRTASRLVDGARTGVRVSAAAGEGLALLPAIALANGTIELDIRGKDVAQQSFVGVAFHGLDGSTFDAVYFRPFNFKAADSVSRSHAVQYHSPPGHTWDKLRTEQPGKYEQGVSPVPDPNSWFRARIVIAEGARPDAASRIEPSLVRQSRTEARRCVQWRARCDGIAGIHGIPGNVESVSYRF